MPPSGFDTRETLFQLPGPGDEGDVVTASITLAAPAAIEVLATWSGFTPTVATFPIIHFALRDLNVPGTLPFTGVENRFGAQDQPLGGSIVYRTAVVPAGNYVFALRAFNDLNGPAGSYNIDPLTRPTSDHASIYLQASTPVP